MNTERVDSANVPAAEDHFHRYLNRTIMLLGEDAVLTLRKKTVAIAGCGGHGGAACLTLARMGVGGFILADPKPFDEPDINRQWAANLSTLGRNKAQVYEEMLRSINPEIRIRTFCEGVTEENTGEFLDQADMLIDCLDVAVPGALRKGMFAAAKARGLHAATAAMIGFGGLVAVAAPDGVPLETIASLEEDFIQGSELPPRFHEVFVPGHLALLRKYLKFHRAPSVAVAPAILGTLLSVEATVILLGATIPGWRPPLCLPWFLLVDLLRMNYSVAQLDEFARKPAASTDPSSVSVPAGSKAPAADSTPKDREAMLRKAQYNTNLLPDEAVDVDLLTDSWGEIGLAEDLPHRTDVNGAATPPEPILQGLFGYEHFLPVFRGRFAEALLARVLAAPGGVVVSNALFPTTRFHLEAGGLVVRELLPPDSYDLQSRSPFKGNLDVAALRSMLSGPAAGTVKLVYLETCVNALGGHPISIENLREIREAISGRGIRVVLDATRAFENAVIIQQREPAFADKPLAGIVREMCSYSDACAASLTKDFKCAAGGFVGTSNGELYTHVCDMVLAFGDGLSGPDRNALGRALGRFEQWNEASRRRVAQVQRLWEALGRLSVPLASPAGGHGLFVDARSFLAHLPPDKHPLQALANELFVVTGVRAGANLASPEQVTRGIQLLRLAIPIARYSDDALESVTRGFEMLMVRKDRVRGLRRVGGPPGVRGEFAATYYPEA